MDAGSGLGPAIARLASAAGEVVVVTTPEPTSVADAHAAIRRLRRLNAAPPGLRAVVNQSASAAEAGRGLRSGSRRRAHQFFGAVVDGLGHVRADPHVPLAVRARRPFAVAYPGAAASRDVRRLARIAGRAGPDAAPVATARLLRLAGRPMGPGPGRRLSLAMGDD